MAVVVTMLAALAAPGAQAASGGFQSYRSTPVSDASTSSRGVTATTINVAFPVVSLTSLAGKLGFAEDLEYGEQSKAIDFFVKQINEHGGIDGRKINPIITYYDPTNDAQMRADCEQWTQGSPGVFAVIDGVGTWTGASQLCVTQQGHTPLLSNWATVTSWTQQGSPYLWWTGPDDSAILQAVVNWGLSSGRFAPGRKVAVLAGDRASDQDALHQYLLPDLEQAGVKVTVKEIAANPSEAATTDADAPLLVQQLEAEKVNEVIPLLPINAFIPVLQAETTQHYFPGLLLSDYEDSILSSLGIVPEFPGALNGQEGLTTETLGGIDDNRPESQGGYDPGVRACYDAWHKAYPKPVPGALGRLHRGAGPDSGVVHVHRPVRHGGQDGGSRPEPPDLRRGDVAASRTSRAASHPYCRTARTSTTGRCPTGWCACTSTRRRRRSARPRRSRPHRGSAGWSCRGGRRCHRRSGGRRPPSGVAARPHRPLNVPERHSTMTPMAR